MTSSKPKASSLYTGAVPSVLQVVLSLEPGGTERLVVELVRRLRPVMPMAVCCLDTRGAWGDQLAAEGVSVHVLGRQPGFHPSLAGLLRRAALSTGSTVLHCHQYSPFVYAALARVVTPSLRVVFTEHGRLSDAPPSRKRQLVNPLLARAGNRLFSVSHDLKRHMIEEGLPASRIEVIHNGIDIGVEPIDVETRARRRSEIGVASDTCLLVTVARLDPVKDLKTLIEAVGRVRLTRSNITLAIIGDGPERQALEAAAAIHDAAAVRFLGHRDDAREWLGAADVFVNSSVSEGISLTILEGMAASLPVVATRVGGTPEVVDETCGILVPARDAAALAVAIEQLAGDDVRRQQLGRAGRSRVARHFTMDRMLDDYARVYEGVG